MTNVYHKTAFSGVCTYFESLLHDSYKIGMVYYTLLNRCFLISSNWSMFLSQRTLLKNLFWKNIYLENFIDIFLKIFLNKTYVLAEKFLNLSWDCVGHLAVKNGEHIGISPLSNKRVQARKDSAIGQHLWLVAQFGTICTV